MLINVQTISHDHHRYAGTTGDWWIDSEQSLQIRVSKLSDARFEWCVILHEIVEAVLCLVMNVEPTEVDKFDRVYESARKPDDVSEPGDQPDAPYHEQHVVASICERAIAFILGINWNTYTREIEGM